MFIDIFCSRCLSYVFFSFYSINKKTDFSCFLCSVPFAFVCAHPSPPPAESLWSYSGFSSESTLKSGKDFLRSVGIFISYISAYWRRVNRQDTGDRPTMTPLMMQLRLFHWDLLTWCVIIIPTIFLLLCPCLFFGPLFPFPMTDRSHSSGKALDKWIIFEKAKSKKRTRQVIIGSLCFHLILISSCHHFVRSLKRQSPTCQKFLTQSRSK